MSYGSEEGSLHDLDRRTLRSLITQSDNEAESAIVFSDGEDIIPFDNEEQFDDGEEGAGNNYGEDEGQYPEDDYNDDYDDSGRAQTPIDFGFSDEEDGDFIDEDIDEDFEFRNALREATNFKVKKKKGQAKKTGGLATLRRRMRQGAEPTPEVKKLLSEANEAFVRNDLQVAMDLYLAIVKLDNKNFPAYKTLGEIYKMQGNFNKCSNFWLLAAHLHPWDYEFWRMLAELSVKLGHMRQALYCYSKAIKASHNRDYASIFDRAILYREKAQYKRAAESFQKLRQALPTETKVIRELAMVYVEQNRINDAISMYCNILEDNISYRKALEDTDQSDVPPLKSVEFGWSELNILSELYGKRAAWSTGCSVIRRISRWLQMREGQTWWDDKPDEDIEFDDRRYENKKYDKLPPKEKLKDYELPIDIRIQLGSFRLNAKKHDEALKHFYFLLDENVEETGDLYLLVGTELERVGLYEHALKFLQRLSYFDDYNTSDLVMSIAKCLREVGDFEQARTAYTKLLAYDPSNVEVKVALAEVCFYLNDNEATTKLYLEARKQMAETERKLKSKSRASFPMDVDRRPESTSQRSNLGTRSSTIRRYEGADTDVNSDDNYDYEEEEEDDDYDDLDDDDKAFIREQALIADQPNDKRKTKRKPITAMELNSMEQRSITRTKEIFARANRLIPGVEAKESFAIATWTAHTSELIEIFSRYRCFFPPDKANRFTESLRQRSATLNIDKRLSRITYLREETILSKELDNSTVTESGRFKEIPFDDWFDSFIRYALLIAEYENDVEDALYVLEVARNVNVFKSDRKKELTLTLVGLSVGVIAGDINVTLNQLRTLMNEFQFSIPVLKTFLATAVPSQDFLLHYAESPNQKYMLRQVKSYDSVREGREITGMASVTNDKIDKTKTHPLLSYIYASLLYCNKSFFSALTYAFKTYSGFNKDPTIIFLVAMCHLHRSMQRLAINKNFQILQGLTYLTEYAEIKAGKPDATVYNKMEINYNFGRAFHLLGLTTLALPYYEKVLELGDAELELESTYDLRREAAYNMYLIYSFSRNMGLAEKIMDKYLVI
ncbi:hypothetical protein B5S33_g4843 [[Candida] boidinii]|nr:hypothetical protein B5S30_g3941 [[Candida] boidinii]OWB86161.1 hypothetical protein B5S33_g4843 [[Candida] boidinii]GMF98046.1 unnamed protein product [[Candida] boidinii]